MRSAEQQNGDTVLENKIEQTGDRLAAAVEALAFKKAHLKDEVIELAEEKADHVLVKAEEAKDHLVAKIGEKIPDRSEVKAIASSVAAKIGGSALEAGQVVVEKAAEAEEAASEAAGKVVDTVAHAGETVVAKLRHLHDS